MTGRKAWEGCSLSGMKHAAGCITLGTKRSTSIFVFSSIIAIEYHVQVASTIITDQKAYYLTLCEANRQSHLIAEVHRSGTRRSITC